ncbi:MAG: hypothetical protein A2383_02025 [Candidatus Pacebacteria bacterium RIFOXYB1_FULL_39_46]|nr:MAG: hypothetical protein A2182_03540 [Candidatus Pacebacteria bacterium RIFOXYA1_FULL_38_18]OGJ37946.1 MAG: hypothetical protein A2383_02025 [Candidatus Pacebacteria bacterium RIFOXYB1_FULL_39_46]OGJ39544.1 MAG: hypothetical protein A2411_02180 [Candidatus Pacebacteria bacterium RIFOXYC1_FULL_39_21]OGJ40125.1 MAG: hypothetical protein A2582_03470 [Candidatus Pacebacteria bacterium RIFOXYD1_FULL_39_27]
MKLPGMQPHSGAIMLALYHFLHFPDKANFDIRMTSPFSKVYRVTREQAARDVLIFRTGKDWPCYCRVYLKEGNTAFDLHHDHSSATESLRLSGTRIYSGRLHKESGLYVEFTGDFWQPKTLELKEEYRLSSGLHVSKRYYEVESVW